MLRDQLNKSESKKLILQKYITDYNLKITELKQEQDSLVILLEKFDK